MNKSSLLGFFIALTFSSSLTAQVISLKSLLGEMADPAMMAKYPLPEYHSLQASSYNRESVSPDQPGWFADSDGVAWIREESKEGKTEYVVMEHTGPGCITRLWTPFFYYDFNNRKGPNIRIYLDGKEVPVIDECFIELLSGKGSIRPPFATFTARAGVCYLPIPYAKSCKITMTSKAFYNIVNYRAYPKGTRVKSFSMKEYGKVAEELARTSRELAAPSPVPASSVVEKTIRLKDEETVRLADGEHAVSELKIRIDPAAGTQALRSTILEMTFDGERTVWCPVGDFFCSADKVNPFNTRSRQVLPDGTMICRYVMPYEKSAQIRLINLQKEAIGISITVKAGDWKWDERSMHFSAAWKPVGTLTGETFCDMNFIDIRGKGVLAGDALSVLSPGEGWWGEGDEKIYINQTDVARKFPSHFGTGTEDYYGWAGGVNPTGRDTFSIPIGANICVGNPLNPRGYNTCTRSRILDAIPFTNRLKFDMEASPGTDIRNSWNLLDYSLVTFWYARPGAETNASPQWEKAAQPIPTLADIDRQQAFLKDGSLAFGQHQPVPMKLTARPDQFKVFSLIIKPGTQPLDNLKIQFPALSAR
jgi:hypothetical protein